jgi:hypothetical protein
MVTGLGKCLSPLEAIERVTSVGGEVLGLIVSAAERQTFAKSISNIHHRKMDNFM